LRGARRDRFDEIGDTFNSEPTMRTITSLFLAASLLAAAFAAAAQPDPGDFSQLSAEQLKINYLGCDRISTERALSFEEAHFCVLIGEALKKREFGGSFARLMDWWRSEKRRAELAAAGREESQP
jgi:hypothetical protein